MKSIKAISFWTGYCSLSLEIAWVRLYGYANLSTPKAFAFVLVVYLLGIAFGAQLGKRICQKLPDQKIQVAGVFLLFTGAIIAALAPWIAYYSRVLVLDDLLTPLSIFLTSGVLAALFPITHHLGTPKKLSDENPGRGRSFSNVYILNVLGASLGPLVTGYFLFEYFTTSQIFAIIPMVLAILAIYASLSFGITSQSCKWIIPTALGVNVILTVLLSLAFAWPHSLIEKFSNIGSGKIVAAHEGRHGIITIAQQENSKDRELSPDVDHVVYGGNVYDGKTNVDLEKNTNGLERPLALHVLRPDAKKVLVVGLSIGSWLTVVEGFPGVEEIDVLEIDSGYVELAEKFGPQRRAIRDPRVNIYIDDARRWLKFNSDKKYDIILMNATLHWRANASMLLSKEMLELLGAQLNERGVLAFNATGSMDSFFTASQSFNEARRYLSFIYAANWKAFEEIDNPESWERLRHVSVDGRPGFSSDTQAIKKYSQIPFVEIESDARKIGRKLEIITDDNMLVEYKYGLKNR